MHKRVGKTQRGVSTSVQDAPVNAQGTITSIQKGVINGLGQALGFTDKSLDEWLVQEYGSRIDDLSRRDAAHAVSALKRGSVNR